MKCSQTDCNEEAVIGYLNWNQYEHDACKPHFEKHMAVCDILYPGVTTITWRKEDDGKLQ